MKRGRFDDGMLGCVCDQLLCKKSRKGDQEPKPIRHNGTNLVTREKRQHQSAQATQPENQEKEAVPCSRWHPSMLARFVLLPDIKNTGLRRRLCVTPRHHSSRRKSQPFKLQNYRTSNLLSIKHTISPVSTPDFGACCLACRELTL